MQNSSNFSQINSLAQTFESRITGSRVGTRRMIHLANIHSWSFMLSPALYENSYITIFSSEGDITVFMFLTVDEK